MSFETQDNKGGVSSATAMLQATNWISQKIANLEGWRHMEPNGAMLLPVTLQNLDQRARSLEQHYSIELPPPMQAPTWETLEFRVQRMDRRSAPLAVICVPTPTVPLDKEAALSALRVVLANFSMQPWDIQVKDVDWPPIAKPSVIVDDILDEKAAGKQTSVPLEPPTETCIASRIPSLSCIAQSLCWAAGRHHWRAPDNSGRGPTSSLSARQGLHTLAEVYSFAIELSMAVPNPTRTLPRVPVTLPMMPGMMGPPRPPGAVIRVAPTPMARPTAHCSNWFCTCACHSADMRRSRRRTRSVSTVSTASTRSSIVIAPRRKRWFGWMRKLWCFGSKKAAYDTESEASSSSSTIVD